MSDQQAIQAINALAGVIGASFSTDGHNNQPSSSSSVVGGAGGGRRRQQQATCITADDNNNNNNSNNNIINILQSSPDEDIANTRLDTSNSADYYNNGSAEVATESALTLAKIQHVSYIYDLHSISMNHILDDRALREGGACVWKVSTYAQIFLFLHLLSSSIIS